MVNVKDKKCKCGKTRPIYNEPGQTKAICCMKCKTNTMVDVINKKCKYGKTQLIYNEPGQTKAICCIECKTNTMVNVISKNVNAVKHNRYNEPGETNRYVVSCKTNTMVNVISKNVLNAVKHAQVIMNQVKQNRYVVRIVKPTPW